MLNLSHPFNRNPSLHEIVGGQMNEEKQHGIESETVREKEIILAYRSLNMRVNEKCGIKAALV